jgi:hypothetical protein
VRRLREEIARFPSSDKASSTFGLHLKPEIDKILAAKEMSLVSISIPACGKCLYNR